MDVSFLSPVLDASGPFATVCADVTHTTENAAAEVELRVRAATGQLSEQGAPEAVVEAVRSRLLEANEGGEAGRLKGRALVVAADGSVLLDQALVDAPVREVAEWSPQPNLMPVLRQLPGRIPHIVVVADRVGADVTFMGGPGEVEEETVEGDSFRIHKFPGGGWSQHRYQHTVENNWIANADDVAAKIASMARRLAPRFVLVAGDVRARQILTDRAGGEWKDLVVDMDEGGRAAGADREPVERRMNELLAEHEARECAQVLEQVQAAAAHGLSVTGVRPVVEALRKSQVETLVLADEQPDDATLLVGNGPLELGVDQHDMDSLGTHGTVVPADRALLAAAVAGSAAVVVVPKAAMTGEPVAAVLRYTDASTASSD